MMIDRLAAALLLGMAAPLLAAPTVRALYVGINDYQFSVPRDQDGLHDLNGAVPDVRMLKAVLRAQYGVVTDPLLLDGPRGSECRGSVPGGSITLVDLCATRANILAALRQQIEASKPGDIVLFYYSGHGASRVARTGDQITGKSSTIVPSDRDLYGKNPDIYDYELRNWLAAATAGGVSVVTIFDSCSSGTATRDLEAERPGLMAQGRSAPAPVGPRPPPLDPPVLQGSAPGAYLVHLAAVADDGIAEEVLVNNAPGSGGKDEVHGVFTRALVSALAQPRIASYREIADEVLLTLQRWGETQAPVLRDKALDTSELLQLNDKARAGIRAQRTASEGGLDNRFLGAQGESERVYDGKFAGGDLLRLERDGSISGVSEGSVFDVFRSRADMLPGRAGPIGRAIVRKAAPFAAELKLLAPIAGIGAGSALAVRERDHNYGAQRLSVALRGATPAERAQVMTELAPLDFVVIDGPQPAFSVIFGEGSADCRDPAGGRNIAIRRVDGTLVRCVGAASDEAWPRRVATTARAAANYAMLAGLRNTRGAQVARVGFSQVSDCADGEERCDFAVDGKIRVAPSGIKAAFSVQNTSSAPLYVYALFLSATDYRVQPLNVTDNANDNLLPPNASVDVFTGNLGVPGTGKLLVLMTAQPISIGALRQDPVRDIEMGTMNPLERVLAFAGAGQRGTETPHTGDWGASVIDFAIRKPAIRKP